MDRNNSALRAGLWLVGRYGLLLIPLLFMILFFLYPLGSILAFSFQQDGVWDFSGFWRIATSRYYLDTLFFTLFQAVLSTGITIGFALPSAYIFSHYNFRFRKTILALSSVAFVLPTVVVATALSAVFGKNGAINALLQTLFTLETPPLQLERTLIFILIAHVFYNYAVALRMITAYWVAQSPRMEEVARVLGANQWQLWLKIRLPMLRPAIWTASALVFIFTFTSFGVVLLLGGIRFATLEVQIYYQALSVFNLPMAGALSVVQMGFMVLLMWGYTRLQRHTQQDLRAPQTVLLKARHWGERLMVYGVALVVSLFLFAPLGVLIWHSLTWGQPEVSFRYYELLGENTRRSALFAPPLVAVANSLFFALITTVWAVLLGGLASALIQRFRWADVLFMLPLATSAVTLGFGFIVAFDEPPLNLRASWVIVPVAHTLVALPFVIRSILPLLRGIPPHLTESARLLGASRWQVWRWVVLPLVGRGVGIGAVFAFTVSMGEFGASLFVARPDTPTIPIVVFQLLGQPLRDNYGQSLAISVLLLGVCMVAFFLIETLQGTNGGEF